MHWLQDDVYEPLGARITRSQSQEIAFVDVTKRDDNDNSDKAAALPSRFNALHWHRDRYVLPPGAHGHHKSDACVNQSFSWGRRVVGLHYHLEAGPADVRRWLEHETPAPSRYVQSGRTILGRRADFAANNRYLQRLLEQISPTG